MNELQELIHDIEQIADKAGKDKKTDKKVQKELSAKLVEISGHLSENKTLGEKGLKQIVSAINKLPKQIKRDVVKVGNWPRGMKILNLKDIPTEKVVEIKEPKWLDKFAKKFIKNQGVAKDIFDILSGNSIPVDVVNKKPVIVQLAHRGFKYKASGGGSIGGGGPIPFKDSNGQAQSALDFMSFRIKGRIENI